MAKITFKIKRFHPEGGDKKPRWQEYTIDLDPKDRVLDGLNYIKWHVDPTLNFRRSCAHGVCGSDGMTINGKNGLACQILVENLGTSTITVEPLKGFRIIRDLIVDMEPFWEKYRAIKPYLVNTQAPPATERLQSPEDNMLIDDASKCILCACCTSSCPSYWSNDQYLGPAALLKAFRFIYDSRDEDATSRLEVVNDRNGAWRCHTIFNCMEACPKEIDITKAISQLKRAAAFQKV